MKRIKFFFLISFLSLISFISSFTCEENVNHCLKCNPVTNLCYKCDLDIYTPDSNGGCRNSIIVKLVKIIAKNVQKMEIFVKLVK